MNIIPKSFIQAQWRDTIDRIDHGELTFVAPDGTVTTIKGAHPGPRARFEIKDWDVISRAAARGDIGLGEDYIAGAWKTDSVEALISLFLLNMEQFEGFAHGSFFSRLKFVMLNTLVRRNSKSGSKRNIEAHYDVGNDFYRLWLDETMTYSSALFSKTETSLVDAQRAKYARLLDKVQAERSNMLEIGCGWGGLAEAAVARGHDLTGVTISPAQHAFATNRLSGKADIRLQDYRDIRGVFDNIVSIEMFEAVGERYWPGYFQTISERLKRGGRALIQTITVHDDIFAGYRTRSDFIRQYVFPGGMLPSIARFQQEAAHAGLKVLDSFAFGQHYAETLRKWSDNQRAAEQQIRALGYNDAFLRNWEFYLGMCAAAFAVGRTDVYQVELVHA
jgi:cyclopropane-fatty-acyl-phospholipid synthase